MRQRFTSIPSEDPRLTHVLVRTQSVGGYWGRGETIAEAVKAAQYIGSQSKVYIMRCDATARCDKIMGELRYNHRGAIYHGRVMRDRRDVLVSALYQPARLDP